MVPFYDPLRTYEDNYAHGPFGVFREPSPYICAGSPRASFLGHAVNRPFGIPAGPLLNAAFCAAAFRHGYDINVYKTVRTRSRQAHPFPNTLAVQVDGQLTVDRAERPVVADNDFRHVTSITNSFGVPSRTPDEWQPDMAAAVTAAGPGQLLVGSFQGTRAEESTGDAAAAYVADHVRAATLVAETGARVLEMNLSCPNEGADALLCFDTPMVVKVADAVKNAVGDLPVILKLSYFRDDPPLARLVAATRDIVQGYAAVNTISAIVVGPDGHQALPGEGRAVSGVCGAAISWAGLEMVGRLAALRDRGRNGFSIIGVGGVRTQEDYSAMRHAGADVVMSATGAMFDPLLGVRIQGAAEGARIL
jgi:dihydroorotate dehydrogenase (NAD+) catalytic subunit